MIVIQSLGMEYKGWKKPNDLSKIKNILNTENINNEDETPIIAYKKVFFFITKRKFTMETLINCSLFNLHMI